MEVECEWIVLPGGEHKQGPFYVTIRDSAIAAISSAPSASQGARGSDLQRLSTHLLVPGFIDLHTHGVGGSSDVLDFWLHPEHTQGVFPKQGTTSFLATVVFPREYPERTSAILSCLNEAVGKLGNGAIMEGIHAEGPIVNDLGAMPPTKHDMPLVEFERLLDAMPHLRVMTISPHLEANDNYARIQALLKRGVVPALGHDRVASEREILGALACSPSRQMHITHLFNVCSFHHRSPSLVNFGLADSFPSLPQYNGLQSPTVEIVGDMAHVHPLTVSTALRARNFKDIIFVTDSVMEPKEGATVNYINRKLEISADCKFMSLAGQTTLAGSCCSLLNTLHSLVSVLKVPLGEAVAMISENPARIAGLDHIGKVEVGKRADLLLLDKELNLERTIVAGRTEYTRLQ